MRKEKIRLRTTFTYNNRRYEVCGKTKKELEQKKRRKIEKLNNQIDQTKITSSMTVRKWANQCMEIYKVNLSYAAYKNYEYALNHYVLSDIGQMNLATVKQIDCQKCINKVQGLSKYLIGYVYQIMNFIFQKAVENELIEKNPARNILKPKGKTYKHRRAFTNYEEEIFLRAVEKHPHKLVFLLMYGCGCRPSEARKVEGRDFIYRKENLFLHIRGTKTANADRLVPVPSMVKEALPIQLKENECVCLNKNGQPLTEQCLSRAWDYLKRLMNIEMGCKIYRNQLLPPYPLSKDLCTYCLRHTYCTNLQKKGVDIRTAQYLMGHADIQMTANIYTHTSLEYLDDQFEIITKTL